MSFDAETPASRDRADRDIEGDMGGLTPGVLLLILLLSYFLYKIQMVIELSILAILYATAIERPVRSLQHNVSRRAAILVVDGALFAALVVPALALAPATAREVSNVRQREPAQLRQLEQDWQTSRYALVRGPGTRLLDRVIVALEAPPKKPSRALLDVSLRAFKWVVAFLVCVSMAYSYLLEKDRLRQRLLEHLSPGSRNRAARLWDATEAALGGWLRSRLVLGVVVGIVSTAMFGLLRLPYWPLLGILAGLTEPIPILGPWIGGAPAVLLALTTSPVLGFVVVGVILGRQLLVDAVLMPRVTRDTVGLSPLTVFVAVLAGTTLVGAPGALLAIPVAAVVQIAIVDYSSVRRGNWQAPIYGWRWLLTHRSETMK